MPRVQMASLTAMGTPARGPSVSPRARLASRARACASASSRATCEERVRARRRARRCARARSATSPSRRSISPRRTFSAISDDPVRSCVLAHSTNVGHGEAVALGGRGLRERLLAREAGERARPRARGGGRAGRARWEATSRVSSSSSCATYATMVPSSFWRRLASASVSESDASLATCWTSRVGGPSAMAVRTIAAGNRYADCDDRLAR